MALMDSTTQAVFTGALLGASMKMDFLKITNVTPVMDGENYTNQFVVGFQSGTSLTVTVSDNGNIINEE